MIYGLWPSRNSAVVIRQEPVGRTGFAS